MRDWLSHRVEIEPDGEALVHAATGDEYTFAHLDTLVDDTAGRLSALGVERGEHLGVVLRSGFEYVCLVHAAMRLGVTLVPMGEGLTPRELAGQITTADVTTVVCGESTEGDVVDAVSRLGDSSERDAGSVSIVTVDGPRAEVSEPFDEAPIEPVTPAEWSLDDVQLVLFTSGTTGDPKAVQLTTENLLASAVSSVFRVGFDPAERWLVTLSPHHMGGIAPILRMPLYGMTVVVREGFDAGATADDIDRYDVTAVSLVPTMLRRMLDRRGTLADSLRVVLLGGAPASPELIERCRDYSVPVHPTYGMTETASQIATARPEEAFEDPGTVGRPLFLTEVTVVGDDGAPLPAGEPGELVVAGPTVTPGYFGDDEATADAFGEYGLHTGDVGVVRASGTISVLNRLDDRIVTGGENVDPGEVIDVLVSHPDVRDVAVVGVPDTEWGERVSALVVPDRAGSDRDPPGDPSGTAPIDRSELIEFARDRLAGFKLPKTIAFTDSIPRTVSGTVDREAVRATFTGGGDGSETGEAADSADGSRPDASPADLETVAESVDDVGGNAASRNGDVSDNTGEGVSGDTGGEAADSEVSGNSEVGTADSKTNEADVPGTGESDATEASETDATEASETDKGADETQE